MADEKVAFSPRKYHERDPEVPVDYVQGEFNYTLSGSRTILNQDLASIFDTKTLVTDNPMLDSSRSARDSQYLKGFPVTYTRGLVSIVQLQTEEGVNINFMATGASNPTEMNYRPNVFASNTYTRTRMNAFKTWPSENVKEGNIDWDPRADRGTLLGAGGTKVDTRTAREGHPLSCSFDVDPELMKVVSSIHHNSHPWSGFEEHSEAELGHLNAALNYVIEEAVKDKACNAPER